VFLNNLGKYFVTNNESQGKAQNFNQARARMRTSFSLRFIISQNFDWLHLPKYSAQQYFSICIAPNGVSCLLFPFSRPQIEIDPRHAVQPRIATTMAAGDWNSKSKSKSVSESGNPVWMDPRCHGDGTFVCKCVQWLLSAETKSKSKTTGKTVGATTMSINYTTRRRSHHQTVSTFSGAPKGRGLKIDHFLLGCGCGCGYGWWRAG